MGEVEYLVTPDPPLTSAIGKRAEELLDRLFEISLGEGARELDQIRAIEVLFRISREERLLVMRELEVRRKFAKTAQDIADGDSAGRDRAKQVLAKMLENGDLPPDVAKAYEVDE